MSDPKWEMQAFCGIIWVIWGPDEVLELHHYLSLLSPGELPLRGQEFLVAVDSINIQASVLHRKDVQHAGKHLLLFLTLQNQWRFHGIVWLHCRIPAKFRNFTHISDTMISSCDGQGWSYYLKAKQMWYILKGLFLASNGLPCCIQLSLVKLHFCRLSMLFPRILLADTPVESFFF